MMANQENNSGKRASAKKSRAKTNNAARVGSKRSATKRQIAIADSVAEGARADQAKSRRKASPEKTAPDPPEKTLAWLKVWGARLDEAPAHEALRVGCDATERAPITMREYTMHRLLKIRDKCGSLRDLLLNHAQLELERRSTHRNIVLKARQLGVTTYVAARFFVKTISREGTLSVQVAHDQRSAEEIFRIVHRFLDHLPQHLREGALVTSRANVRQIVFPMLDSEYRVETAADPNAGRGLTIQNLHCSEVARWPRDVAETLASLRAAVPPDGEIFLESTPNGAGGVFYNEWLHAGATGYTQHFFPWWWDPSYRRAIEVVNFSDEELALMEKHGLDAGQIAFRREMRAHFRNRAREEFAEDATSCFLHSGECVFDLDVIERRLQQQPLIADEGEYGKLITFLPPVRPVNGRPARRYIVGVDPAGGGIYGDYSCAQVIDYDGGMQCAELHGHFSPQELAARLKVLAHNYNDALVAVERNNHGHAVLAHLLMGQSYTNVYQQGGENGWLTTSASRPTMLARLDELIGQAPYMFLSPRLLEECRTFIRHPDGSCSAAKGTHDDTVMAMAIAHAVRAELRVQLDGSAADDSSPVVQVTRYKDPVIAASSHRVA